MDNYVENEQQVDFPDFDLVYRRWQKKKKLKAENQITIYKAISNVWCVGKTVVDAGCGIGIGTNILGWNALGVLGVDNNRDNVEAATQFFESPKIKFEHMDLTIGPERPIATADVVACIEVIEHVKDFQAVLTNLKRFYDPKRRTVFFISSPNRNSSHLAKDKPANPFHVREWTAGEFYEVLVKNFKHVVLYDGPRLNTFGMDETMDGNGAGTPAVAKCEEPI